MACSIRARVAGRTLSGSLKNFDTVDREMPLAAQNSSMVVDLGGGLSLFLLPTSFIPLLPLRHTFRRCMAAGRARGDKTYDKTRQPVDRAGGVFGSPYNLRLA